MSFWTWFGKSFFNKKIIAYARFRPATQTLLHVIVVMLIASIPYLVSMNTTAINGVNHVKESLQSDLPAFYLENGILHLDEQDAILIDDPNRKQLY